MSISTDQAVYRVRRFYRKGDLPQKYKCTFEMTDDRSGQVMAVCDSNGRAAFTALAIVDHRQESWQMTPNRKIMPSRWVVTDPGQNIAMQFDQKILGKMTNPLYRIVLALLDGKGEEIYRLIDPRSNIPDRILGLAPHDWALLRGDRPAAKLVYLPRQEEPAKGIFSKLKKILASSDRGIVSAGSAHALPAPVALGMLMLFNELTDATGG